MSQRWIALLQRRRAEYRNSDRVLNIAHRGASGLAPANTIAAIDTASEAGADMIEIDVHLSRDGQLVVMHDLREELPLAEIQARDPTVPTLTACMSRAQELGLLVNVEIKNLPKRYAQIEEKIVAMLKELEVSSDVLISSFDHESLAAVRRLNERIAIAVLTQDRLFQPVEYLTRLDADALHPGGYVPDKQMVDAVRDAGRGVNVWTENDLQGMRRLIACGVTGIITDYPNRLRELLDAGS